MIRNSIVLLVCIIIFQIAIIGVEQLFGKLGISDQTQETVKSDVRVSASSNFSVHIPILLYHYISTNPNPQDIARYGLSTEPAIFEQQLVMLIQQGYTTITLDELYEALTQKTQLPAKSVILTFDDGYADFYENVYPILLKYKMKATQFIPTGLINKPNYMTENQLRELAQSPFITLAAHTVSHANLTKISDESLHNEIFSSKKDLENYIQKPVQWFAYPFGAYTEKVVQAVKDAGFKGAVSTIKGNIHAESTMFTLHRVRPGSQLFNDFLIILE